MKTIKPFTLTAVLLGLSFSTSAGDLKENLSVGFQMNAQKLFGDSQAGDFEYGWNPISVRYNFRWHAYVESDIGFSQLSTGTPTGNLNTDIINFGAKLGYRFLSERKITPIVYFGLGVFNFKTGDNSRFWDGYGAIGGGAELFVTNYLGLNVSSDLRYTTGDDFDGTRSSTARDAFINMAFGVNYYFGGRSKHSVNDQEFTAAMLEPGVEVEEVKEPIEAAPVENAEVAEMSTEPPRSANYDPLVELRENLRDAIDDRDREIRLLNAKLNALEGERMELELRVGNGGMPFFTQRGEDERAEQLRRRLQAALDYFADTQYEDAILSLKSILYEDPDGPLSSICWYWLGECHFSRAEYYAGIESFEIAAIRAPVDSPRREMAQIMLALSRLKLGETEAAKESFEKVLANLSNEAFGPIVHEYLIELSGQRKVKSAN